MWHVVGSAPGSGGGMDRELSCQSFVKRPPDRVAVVDVLDAERGKRGEGEALKLAARCQWRSKGCSRWTKKKQKAE